MRKTLKVIGIFLAAVVVLIVVLAVALPLFVDPNDFKPRIQSAVADATGRELEIRGDLELSVFPWLGVDLGPVSLANAEGFGEEPFASLEGAQVRVKLLPLLSGNVKVGKVVVDSPVIRLQRKADGSTNWDDLAGEGEQVPEEAAGEQAPPEFSVDGVELRNAHVLYQDAASGLDAELTDFNLRTGELGLPAEFPLSMDGRLRVSEPQLSGAFEFKGNVSVDPEQQRYAVAQGQLVLDAEGKALPVSPLPASLEWTDVSANLAEDTASVKELSVSAMGLDASTSVDVASLTKQPSAAGTLSFEVDDLASLSKRLGDLLPKGLALSGPANGELAFSYDQQKGSAALKDARIHVAGATVEAAATASSLNEKPQASGSASLAIEDLAATTRQLGSLAPEGLALDGPANARLSFAYDGGAGTAQLPELTAQILGIDLKASANAENLNDQAKISGQLHTGEFSPGRLLVKLGQELPATRDGNVLELAALDTKFSATPNSVALNDLKVRLDQSKLTGSLQVADIEKQALRFNLALDAIDADRYLPPADEAAADEAGAETPLDQIELPADLVRGLDIDGQLSIGKLKAFDFNSTDVEIGVRAQQDVLRLHPLQASFYGGGYRGDMQLDARKDVPRVSVDEHVERVQLAPLVKDVLQVENLSGTAKMDVAAKARGRTLGDLRKTLGGNFAVDVQDGAIEGFNLWESIRQAYATLKGRPYDAGNAPDRTEFAELSATGKISKGVIDNNDLKARLPFLSVTGAGQIDIAKATLDYTIETKVLKSPELKGGIEELTGTTIPVRLTGPLTDPKVRPDVKGVLEQKAKEAAKRKEQELRDEAKRKADEEKKKLEDKLKDKLKDFF